MGTRLPVTLLVLPSGALLLRISALQKHSWCVEKKNKQTKPVPGQSWALLVGLGVPGIFLLWNCPRFFSF